MKSLLLAIAAILVAGAGFAQNGYRVSPGDVLGIEVLQDPSLNREVLVLPDGSFSFPFAGTIPASGRTIAEISDAVASGIAGNFATPPNVFVSVRTLRGVEAGTGMAAANTISVYFLGEFAAPGMLELEHGTTFMQALAASGGLSPFAAERRIQLRRTDRSTGRQSVVTIDYRAIQNGGQLSNDIHLRDGDVILAPERRLFE